MERFFLFDQVIEWDKDDIDALKFMKVDVQPAFLTVIRRIGAPN
jgi:hypothetical protein